LERQQTREKKKRKEKETGYLPSKAAWTLLLRFKLEAETLGRIEEVVKGPPVDEGGLVKLININSNEALAPNN
jgi:hypothetical protein